MAGQPLQFVHASVNQLRPSCNTTCDGPHSFNQPKLGVMMIFGLFKKKNANQRIVEQQYARLTAAAHTASVGFPAQ